MLRIEISIAKMGKVIISFHEEADFALAKTAVTGDLKGVNAAFTAGADPNAHEKKFLGFMQNNTQIIDIPMKAGANHNVENCDTLPLNDAILFRRV